MEPRFGHDFSRVRVHADTGAAESARAVDAQAYTVGSDVVFGTGQYRPQTGTGQRLLAHELAHVVQQRHAPTAGFPLRFGEGAEGDDRMEQEAEAAAGRVLMGEPAGLGGASVPRRMQRQAAGGAPVPPATSAPPAASARPAAPPRPEVIAIRLGHQEAGGLGRFDTLLYRDCMMKVQFRMNFNFLGPWPNHREKQEWQQRFLYSVKTAWSRQYELAATKECPTGCPSVTPFVEIYAPHASPHVTVDVTHTATGITSSAGYGVAHLDSLDLTPERKRAGVEPMVPAVHEFGHLAGRPDLYRAATGTCAPGYPLEGVMCFGNTVTADDYQPFANALNQMTACSYKVGARRAVPAPRRGHAGLGGFLGALAGTALGFLVGGPIGAFVGLAAGVGLGALIGSRF